PQARFTPSRGSDCHGSIDSMPRPYGGSSRRIFKNDYGRQSLTAASYPYHVAFEWRAWRLLRSRTSETCSGVSPKLRPWPPDSAGARGVATWGSCRRRACASVARPTMAESRRASHHGTRSPERTPEDATDALAKRGGGVRARALWARRRLLPGVLMRPKCAAEIRTAPELTKACYRTKEALM